MSLSFKNPSVSVIIPTLNEAKNLPFVLPRIPRWIDEVVLVDGNSTDDTVQVARTLRPDVRIVCQQGRGKGAALRQGFAAARGDIIVMLDADGSTDPAEMGRYVRYLRDGADFVKGSRFLQGAGTSDMTGLRRFGNAVLTTFVKLMFGCAYTDLCYGYMAFWSRILPQLSLDADGFEIETLIAIRALRSRLYILEVHSFEGQRLNGESHLNTITDGWRVLKTILKERFLPPNPRPSVAPAPSPFGIPFPPGYSPNQVADASLRGLGPQLGEPR